METGVEVLKGLIGRKGKACFFIRKIFLIPGWGCLRKGQSEKKNNLSFVWEKRSRRDVGLLCQVITLLNLLLCKHTYNFSQAPNPYHLHNTTKTHKHSHITSFRIWDGSLKDVTTREKKRKENCKSWSSPKETKYKSPSGVSFSALQIPEKNKTLLWEWLSDLSDAICHR